MQKKLFITWHGVWAGNTEVLVPGVIGALLRLAGAGYRLVLLGLPEEQGGTNVVRLLAGQGVHFEHLLAEPKFGSRDLDGSQRLSSHKQVFNLIREDMWAQGLDRSRSAIVGTCHADKDLADFLGLPFYQVGAFEGTPSISGRPFEGSSPFSWSEIVGALLTTRRKGKTVRRTKETDISVEVDLDGDPGRSRIATGIGYFDHMLDQLSRHGGMELNISVKGDLVIDDHHTVEDTGLALGEALRQALGDRRGVARYGFTVPMDETLASCALDLSGRPGLFFKGSFSRDKVGELSTEMVPHFFQSLVQTLGATLHISVEGVNAHHQVEGIFKAVAKTLQAAIRLTGEESVPSTKGSL
jgi:imidazoleglycerol-phosphate dehydratase/histidinol-phosphatase